LKHGSQCCHALYKTFPRKDETGWEGRRRYINTGASDTDTCDSQGWQLCVVIVSETYRWSDGKGGEGESTRCP
jgi:hypothetical protein